MKKKGLTDRQCQHAEAKEKRYEIPAGRGLYLVIHPTGRKGWALRYRWSGITRNLTFREGYPEMTLAQARAEAEDKLEELENGRDPAAVVEEQEREEQPNLCKPVAEEWLKRAVKGTATHDEVERILNKEVLPPWKHRTIDDIKRPDVLRVIDAIVDRKAPVLANRTLSILKRWFRWCVERGYIETAPTAGLRPPAKEQSRDRVLTEEELREIWNATQDLGFPFRDWFRILVLTGQRRNEVSTMQWDHVDLDGALWTLPRESTKARRIHDVPLSAPAKTLLEKAPRFKGPFVFTTTSGGRPISGFSKAKEAIDKAILERRKASGKTGSKSGRVFEWHVHDLRRTLATWCADHDVAPHVVAAILNHSPGSTLGITAIYARSKWAKEKREALAKWADYVVSLEEKKEAVA